MLHPAFPANPIRVGKSGLPEINRHQTHPLQGGKGSTDTFPEQMELWTIGYSYANQKALEEQGYSYNKRAFLCYELDCLPVPEKRNHRNQAEGVHDLPMVIYKDETLWEPLVS